LAIFFNKQAASRILLGFAASASEGDTFLFLDDYSNQIFMQIRLL